MICRAIVGTAVATDLNGSGIGSAPSTVFKVPKASVTALYASSFMALKEGLEQGGRRERRRRERLKRSEVVVEAGCAAIIPQHEAVAWNLRRPCRN